MIAQPYPLWIVWDETDGATRASHYARVLGWRELPDPDRPTAWSTLTGPYPVVVHPDTMLVCTLGHDGPRSVSRIQVIGDYLAGQAALVLRDQRRVEHQGQREA